MIVRFLSLSNCVDVYVLVNTNQGLNYKPWNTSWKRKLFWFWVFLWFKKLFFSKIGCFPTQPSTFDFLLLLFFPCFWFSCRMRHHEDLRPAAARCRSLNVTLNLTIGLPPLLLCFLVLFWEILCHFPCSLQRRLCNVLIAHRLPYRFIFSSGLLPFSSFSKQTLARTLSLEFKFHLEIAFPINPFQVTNDFFCAFGWNTQWE